MRNRAYNWGLIYTNERSTNYTKKAYGYTCLLKNMKELMTKAMPRAIAEVSRFDKALEDLPTRQS